jgi:excisionase family DNA binding protein
VCYSVAETQWERELEELLTVRQLLELLQVDRITVYRMLDRGLIPGFKVGGQWRFSRNEIQAWLKRQQEPVPPDVVPAEGESPAEPSGDLPLHCFQAIQEIAADAAQVAAVIVGTDGRPLTEPRGFGACSQLVFSGTLGRERYFAQWRDMVQDPDPAPKLRLGPDGLWCVGAPVVVSGERVAAVVLGLFALTDDPVPGGDTVARMARDYGIDEEALLEARSRERCIGHTEAQRIQQLATRLAATLSQIVQERLELVNRLKRIAAITAMNS